MDKKSIKFETKLLNNEITVAELSDEHCRAILRRIIKRHHQGLAQAEAQRRADEGSITKLEIESNIHSSVPAKK